MKTGVFLFKKILFIFLAVLLFISFYCFSKTKLFTSLNPKGEYSLYYGSYSSNAETEGWGKLNLNQLFYTGESVEIEPIDFFSLKEQLNLKLIKEETIEQGTSFYCYCAEIPIYKVISGKKVNVQVFYGKDKVEIGSPLIYRDF